MRNPIKLAAALAGVATVGFLGTGVAFAVPAITVTPNTSVANATPLTVGWSGFAAGQAVSIAQCKKSIADPTFSATADCDFPTSDFYFSDAAGGGSKTRDAIVGLVGEDWACLPASAPDPGVARFSTCYIRVAGTAFTDTSTDFEIPITFDTAPAVVPEAPYAVLLSLGAVGVLGGGYFVMRNRRSMATA
jgi:hypothetical protein